MGEILNISDMSLDMIGIPYRGSEELHGIKKLFVCRNVNKKKNRVGR